jgi:hypothetical protein
MRTLFASLALAVTLFAGYATAQTRVPAPQAPPVRVTPPAAPVRVTPVPGTVQAAPLCRSGNAADCDADGSRAISHGGDDCDDYDAANFPGGAEVADVNGHDEDCNAETFGHRDADGDHFITVYAYNTAADGRVFRGDDCNDNAPYINPHAQELPNRLDDDCNGYIDDLAGIWWNPPPGWEPRDGPPPLPSSPR